MNTERHLIELTEQQCWSESTLVVLLMDFIMENGLEDELLHHLENIATEENEWDEGHPLDEDECDYMGFT
jgi:hypothetical protein